MGTSVEDGDQWQRMGTGGREYGLMVENRYQWWRVESSVGGYGPGMKHCVQWWSIGTSRVGQGQVAESCEHSNKISRYKGIGKYLDQLFQYSFSGMAPFVCC